MVKLKLLIYQKANRCSPLPLQAFNIVLWKYILTLYCSLDQTEYTESIRVLQKVLAQNPVQIFIPIIVFISVQVPTVYPSLLMD